MQTVFIVRLLDASRNVLAWCRVPVEARGDGAFWAMAPFEALCAQSGDVVELVGHWPEVNAAWAVPMPEGMQVRVGTAVTLHFTEPLLRISSDPRPLPPVTETRSVTIAVPTGNLGATGL